MSEDQKIILERAREVLEKNWRECYTIPSNTFYTHQWSWDSAFIAIGNSYLDQDRAQRELLALFDGQWKNGMLPHIVFRTESDYFPGPDYWQADIAEHASEMRTSGITQPPMQAIAALEIYNNAKDKEKAEEFLRKIFPKIKKFHEFLLRERDPEKSGLVTIFHPWESGFDNSTRWDESLKRINVETLPYYERTDIKRINKTERPTDDTYDKFLYLIEIMKKHKYDQKEIYEEIPFKVKDVVFSSILYMANKSLLEISRIVGEDGSEIESWLKRTKDNYLNYSYVCDKEGCLVYDYDLITKKIIQIKSIATLFGLITDIMSEDGVRDMIHFMKKSHYCKVDCRHNHKVLTSISVDEKEYNPLNYWRGPIWVNVNWMLYKGLKSYGFMEDAEMIKQSVVNMVKENGFYEYYNPLSGKGLGTNDFSWTASLVVDLILEEIKKQEAEAA